MRTRPGSKVSGKELLQSPERRPSDSANITARSAPRMCVQIQNPDNSCTGLLSEACVYEYNFHGAPSVGFDPISGLYIISTLLRQ